MNLNQFRYEDGRGERSQTLSNLNRSALSKVTGISRSQLSRILSGKANPTMEVLRKLSIALNMNIDDTDQFLKRLK